jgi:predicted phage-related endonuclease
MDNLYKIQCRVLLKRTASNKLYFLTVNILNGENLVNSEFCYESDLLNLLLENNLEILDTNSIIKEPSFRDLETHYSEFLKSEFKRVPPPNTVEGQALGIFGFVAKIKK